MRYQISGPLVHVGGFDQYPVRRGDLVRQSGDWHQSELNVNLLARFDDAAGKNIRDRSIIEIVSVFLFGNVKAILVRTIKLYL